MLREKFQQGSILDEEELRCSNEPNRDQLYAAMRGSMVVRFLNSGITPTTEKAFQVCLTYFLLYGIAGATVLIPI